MTTDRARPHGRPAARWLPLLLLSLAGCASPWDLESTQPRPAPLVDVSGDGAWLGDAGGDAPGWLDLRERVDADLQRGRLELARRRVARFPEVARAGLWRHAFGSSAPTPPLLRELASVLQLGGAGPWSALLAERAQQPQRYVAAGVALADPLELGDDAGETLGPAGGLLVQVEASRRQAAVALASGDREEALERLESALQRSAGAPVLTAELALERASLLRADATRAEAAWRAAIERGLALLTGPHALAAPGWWTRALELADPLWSWPAGAGANLAQAAWPDALPEQQLEQESAAALAWTLVARWHAERREAQAGLLALRRAEQGTRSRWTQGHLRLRQARLLVRLDQSQSAMALLVNLSDDHADDVAQGATALLGSLRLRHGQLNAGYALLRQAVEEGAAPDWPGQAEAEADLGLAYLALGNEERGLSCLHQAQRRFERAGQSARLLRCLGNELRYYEHQDDARAEEVRARYVQLAPD